MRSTPSPSQPSKTEERPREILERYNAWEPRVDLYDYQWNLRLLQSHWRTRKGLRPRFYRGKLRGAELNVQEARATLDNYLSATIRKVVRREVGVKERSRGKVYAKPRIYNHLLSSQPLSFNLFGELSENCELASCVLREMTAGRVANVTAVKFEWSPGRGNARYTGDRSAFDVYVRYEGPTGKRGFLGIEVKYHENMMDRKNNHRERYDQVAEEMGCFRDLSALHEPGPLQQMWRDHLLVGAHRMVDGFDEGVFVFVRPDINIACSSAIERYVSCLSDTDTFSAWSLDDLVECISRHTAAEWVTLFRERYLNLAHL